MNDFNLFNCIDIKFGCTKVFFNMILSFKVFKNAKEEQMVTCIKPTHDLGQDGLCKGTGLYVVNVSFTLCLVTSSNR